MRRIDTGLTSPCVREGPTPHDCIRDQSALAMRQSAARPSSALMLRGDSQISPQRLLREFGEQRLQCRVDHVGRDARLDRGVGSFSPLPVSTHTTVESFGTPYLMMPAIDARRRRLTEDRLVTSDVAIRLEISSSVTARMSPSDSWITSSAGIQLAGLPMRIAVAIVSGFVTGWPRTMGAAPAAWKPTSWAVSCNVQRSGYCVKPRQ